MSMGHSSSAVLLAGGEAQGERDGGSHDDGLPAPEIDPAQVIAEHAVFAQALKRIIDAGEHAVADEGKNHGVGVQGPQASEGGELEIQIQTGPEELAGDEQSGAETHHAPDHGGDGEGADDAVVVAERFHTHGLGKVCCFMRCYV